METKIIINALRECKKPYTVMLDVSAEMIADRLEELESEKENLIHYNADLNNCLNKAEYHIEELEKQLSEKPEWISVEDERKPKHLQNYFIAYVFGNGKEHFFREAIYIADKGNGIVDGPHFNDEGVYGMRVTHWMEIPKVSEPPKPKEPTFRDVFLKAFPKAVVLEHSGVPRVCAKEVFPQLGDDESTCDMRCAVCWSQPYFESKEEGETDA